MRSCYPGGCTRKARVGFKEGQEYFGQELSATACTVYHYEEVEARRERGTASTSALASSRSRSPTPPVQKEKGKSEEGSVEGQGEEEELFERCGFRPYQYEELRRAAIGPNPLCVCVFL